MFERPTAGSEKALIIHLKLRNPRLTADICEFRELALSAGVRAFETITVNINSFDPKFLIGTGKVNEICSLVKENDIDVVLVNHKLSPVQERNLERQLQCRVLDRTSVILDIFAQRAKTFEGKLQVELAQMEHLSTRLVRGWTHLERQKGGIGLRGPGEKQLETDRRLVKDRINTLKFRLEKVRKDRLQSRNLRNKNQIQTVAFVGYTNVGKSTLFNKITGAEVLTANKLFATLDPTLRAITLQHVGDVILADTVGFIRELPHNLIDAFKATLEETKEADLLVHVIDSHDELWQEHRLQVETVLSQIGALNVPILEVYNKIDLLDLEPSSERAFDNTISSVQVSAITGSGLDLLRDAIAERLSTDIIIGKIVLEPRFAKLRAKLYSMAAIDHESIDKSGCWHLEIALRRERWQRLCREFQELECLLKKSR